MTFLLQAWSDDTELYIYNVRTSQMIRAEALMTFFSLDRVISPQWISLCLGFIVILRFLRKRQYPPGPRGFPLVNNLFDFPTSLEHVTFAEWGRKYGDVTYA